MKYDGPTFEDLDIFRFWTLFLQQFDHFVGLALKVLNFSYFLIRKIKRK